VKLVQIFGTWCPNCLDETVFLTEYLKNHPTDKLEIIGIGFERYAEESKSFAQLARYKDRLKIPYEIVLGGTSSSKEKAAEALPMISALISYPTLIFIDKNDKVRKIHTGFSGPATGEFEKYKSEFENFVSKLLAE
jgi:thiol-disulfide isomerase/thioredoxin